MIALPRRYILEALVITSAALILIVGLSYQGARDRAALYSVTQSNFGLVRDRLHTLSELTARNEASPEAQSIATDCAERTRYEEALGTLHLARGSQFQEISALHGACGDFFALRKRVMVREMELALLELERFEAMLSEGGESSTEISEAWQDILAGESKRRDLLDEQVAIQGRIIDSLARNDRKATEPFMLRAKEIAEELAVTHQEIESLRTAEGVLWERHVQN